MPGSAVLSDLGASASIGTKLGNAYFQLLYVFDAKGRLRLFESSADVAKVGHLRSVDHRHACGRALNRGLATFVRRQALAAEGDICRPGEPPEFARGVGQVDDGVGGGARPSGGALMPRQTAGAGFGGHFGPALGVARDEK